MFVLRYYPNGRRCCNATPADFRGFVSWWSGRAPWKEKFPRESKYFRDMNGYAKVRPAERSWL